MGSDPEGILYYGINVAKAIEEEFISADFDDYAMNEAWEDEHRPKQPDDDNKGTYNGPEWDAWRAQFEAYKATPEYVEMTWYGAEDCESRAVHCPCLEKSVEWDEQIDLGFPTLAQQPEADEWIRKFCERFKVPYRQPTWHLAAKYF